MLPTTVNCHENGAFWKRDFNTRNLKTAPGFAVYWGRETLWKYAGWFHNNHVISLPEFCSHTNPKWPVIIVMEHDKRTLTFFSNSASSFCIFSSYIFGNTTDFHSLLSSPSKFESDSFCCSYKKVKDKVFNELFESLFSYRHLTWLMCFGFCPLLVRYPFKNLKFLHPNADFWQRRFK